MTHYSQPPPSYGASGSSPTSHTGEENREPLLGGYSGAGGFYDQPGEDDLPDDFKVSFLRSWREREGFYFVFCKI